LFVLRTNYHLSFFSLAHAEEPADSNDHSRNATLLVDQRVMDAANLVMRRVVDIILIEIGHSAAGRLAEEDLRWIGGSGAGRWAKGAVLMEMRLCTDGTSDIQRLVVAREIAKD
jgi:hypothetical protein